MAKNKQITELNKVGQSIWYDNLSRDVLHSGELAELIASGVSGLTSNPTIFKKAIADSTDYDAEIRKLGAGLSTDALCEELMVHDVAAAADLLRPIYDSTSGQDGYASIEVAPDLAHDTKATVEAAKRLWKKLSRPNVMIKIPATQEGLPAIRTTLEAGINVNITLIFSGQVYRQVADAYIAALEARKSRGEDVKKIASVASFFVSRVDAIVEKALDDAVKSGKVKDADRGAYFGKVGIANSKLAYGLFEELFKGPRFKALADAGAMVQRPLWASTGTKNPKLSPVLYVEELAGPHTVNTVPPATLKALMSDAKVGPRLTTGLSEAKSLVAKLSDSVPFEGLLKELQIQGVKLFADSYRELLDSITQKRGTLASAAP